MKVIRWVAALLCVLLIGSLFPTRAFAADIPWYLDAEGVLHITGEIPESGFNLTDEQKQQVKSAVAESSASISSGKFLFSEFKNMTSADLSLLNTTGVTNMSYMFYGCSSLTSLNLSNFDTISVTTMDGMFSGCSSLTSLDVSAFRTNSVTNMIGMFTNCSSLTSLDLSKLITGNVTSMAFMFNGCSSLTSLDLSKFITGNVTSMAAMFINCSGLTSLDLSSFDTSSVNNMGGMFEGCSSLTSLDVSGFKTDSLMYAEEMFSGCNSFTALGITPDILHENADDIIAIRSPWQKQGSTDTYSTADELKAVTDTVTLLAMYTVNVQNDGNGTASANPAAVAKGSTVTLNESPNAGYHFKEWQSSDVTVSSNNTFTMPEKDVTVKAIFEADEPATYTVTINNDGHGTASADNASAAEGKTITLTATSDAGYRFKEWQSTDVTVTDNKFTMPAKAVTVTAVFEAIPTYTVTFKMNGHGTQVADQTVEDGNKATKPDDPAASGWTFGGWYADATFSARFDFDTAITANTTIYAKWTENTTPPAPTYTIIAGADGEWTKGSTTGLSFTSDAPFAKFDSVMVDESTIAAANYTAEEGSTKITLATAYLETLSIGNHTLTIVSTDGKATTTFIVESPIPATGESISITTLAALLLLCGGSSIVLYQMIKRRKNHTVN